MRSGALRMRSTLPSSTVGSSGREMSEDAGTRSPDQDSVRFGPSGGGRSSNAAESAVEVPPSVASAGVEPPSDEALEALDDELAPVDDGASAASLPPSSPRPTTAQATPVSSSTTTTPSAIRRRRRTCALRSAAARPPAVFEGRRRGRGGVGVVSSGT